MSYSELIMSSQSAGRPFRPKAFSCIVYCFFAVVR